MTQTEMSFDRSEPRADDRMDATLRRWGYKWTYRQLKEAFDAVCDPKDWRGPVAAWVNGEAVTLVVEAVKFFTATCPRVELDAQTMRYFVTSEGYRMGPAGDH